MSTAEQPPETEHRPRERGRLQAQRRRTDDTSERTLLAVNALLAVNKADGSRSMHGLGASGVRLPRNIMVTLAESIPRCTR